MKNFFKNLFGKKYPQRTDDTESGMRRVYAGPLSRKKRMQCVYAGPGMMPKDRVKEKNTDNMRAVYAGPPRSDKDKAMEGVYMGPPVDEDVFTDEEDTPMEDVYMGPEPDEEIFIDEEDTPMEDVYMGPEPDTDEPVEDDGSQHPGPSEEPVMKPVYAGPVNMNMGPQNEPSMMTAYAGPVQMNTDPNKSLMFMAYAGPANIAKPIGIMTTPAADKNESNEVNSDKETVSDPGSATQNPDHWKFCLRCGARLAPDAPFCSECGTKTDKA